MSRLLYAFPAWWGLTTTKDKLVLERQQRNLIKKVDLIEQNQCDFWIQHFKIVLDQLKILDNKYVADQGSTFYINGKAKYVKRSYGAI